MPRPQFHCQNHRAAIAQNALFVLTVALFGFMFIMHPKAWDDYWFTYDIFLNAYDDKGFYDFWRGFKEGFVHRYTCDNSRMCNALAIFALLIPRWIPAVISTVVFAAGYRLMLRVATVNEGQLAKFTLVSLCLIVFPTWHDSFFSTVYLFNYTWGMAIMFWAIHVFLSPKRQRLRKAILLGLLLGCWHESYAAAGFVGLAAVLALDKTMRRPDRWALVASIAAGSIWLVAFPAWRTRISNESGLFDSSFSHLIFSWGYYIFTVFWVVCICSKKWRHIAKLPVPIITLSGGLIVLPAVIASGNGRAAQPAMLLACCGLPYLLSNMFPGRFPLYKPSVKIAVCAIWALIIAHLAMSCRYIAKIRHSADILIGQIENHPSPDDTYFIPIVEEWQASPLAVRKPNFRIFDLNDCNCGFLANNYRTGLIKPVPDVLHNYREGLGTPIKGNTESRLYKGFIVTPLRNYIYKRGAAAIMDYGWHKEFTQIYYAHFKGADSKPYVYIFARRSLLTTLARPEVKGMEIITGPRPTLPEP